jgi:hypothetical protein
MELREMEFENIKKYKNHNDDDMYLLSDLEAFFPIKIRCHEHSYSDIFFIKEGQNIEYGLFEFMEEEKNSVSFYRVIYRGYGYKDMYWGENQNGHTFSLPVDSVIKSLTILKNNYFK